MICGNCRYYEPALGECHGSQPVLVQLGENDDGDERWVSMSPKVRPTRRACTDFEAIPSILQITALPLEGEPDAESDV
jgi:hypothetical protein